MVCALGPTSYVLPYCMVPLLKISRRISSTSAGTFMSVWIASVTCPRDLLHAGNSEKPHKITPTVAQRVHRAPAVTTGVFSGSLWPPIGSLVGALLVVE